MKTLIIIITALLFYSCADREIKQAVQTNELTYPVGIQYFQKDGMDYMIVYTGRSQGGVSLRNLTLDKIQIEYYKSNYTK